MYRILLILMLLPAVSHAAQVIGITEGSVPTVSISNEALNRIVLPSKVVKAYTSNDKPVDITVEGNNAFVKILDPDYHNPIEVFFIGDTTYSLLMVPEHIPSETIFLTPAFEDKRKALAWEREYPYEETIKNLMLEMISGNVPVGFSVEKIGRQVSTPYERTSLTVQERFTGAELTGEVNLLHNFSGEELSLNEIDFSDDNIMAIAMEKNELKTGFYMQVYIIKKAGGFDE